MTKRTKIKKVLGLEEIIETATSVDNILGIDGGQPVCLPEEPTQTEGLIEASFIEGDKISADIETASEDALLLENIRDKVAEKIESGEGINETSAAIIQQTLESIYLRYGYNKRSIPSKMSLENFKSKRSRLLATKITLESIVDLIDSVGKYIVSKMQSLTEWFKVHWEKVRTNMADNYKRLLVLKNTLKKTKSMKKVGESVNIDWIGKHIFSNQGNVKWDVASSNIKNVIRATDLERKVWKSIQEYLGNPNKNMKEFMKPDPFGLSKFSPYLGVGGFIRLNKFNNKASTVLSIEVPSLPSLMEFVDDALSLVGSASITYYSNIEAELSRYKDMVNKHVSNPNNGKGNIANKSDTKKEFQLALDMAKNLIHVFWQIRCKASKSVCKITNYFLVKYSDS